METNMNEASKVRPNTLLLYFGIKPRPSGTNRNSTDMQTFWSKTSVAVMAFFFLITPSWTLFYTNSRENDYPRIGKRVKIDNVLDQMNAQFRKALFSRFNINEHDKSSAMGHHLNTEKDILALVTDSAPIDDLRDAKLAIDDFDNKLALENLIGHFLKTLRTRSPMKENHDSHLEDMVKKFISRQKQQPDQETYDIIEVYDESPSYNFNSILNEVSHYSDLGATYD